MHESTKWGRDARPTRLLAAVLEQQQRLAGRRSVLAVVRQLAHHLGDVRHMLEAAWAGLVNVLLQVHLNCRRDEPGRP
eukprot:4960262-Pleurochrysis_carterae.AAC.2